MVEPSLPLKLVIAKRASINLSPSRLRAFSYTLAHLYLLKIFGVLCCVCVELVLVQKSCCVFWCPRKRPAHQRICWKVKTWQASAPLGSELSQIWRGLCTKKVKSREANRRFPDAGVILSALSLSLCLSSFLVYSPPWSPSSCCVGLCDRRQNDRFRLS